MDERQTEVLDFWFRELTPDNWFAAGQKLDPVVRSRFGHLHDEAAAGLLHDWKATPLGRLALILVLDQFSRHIYRGTARAFAQDRQAQKLTLEGIATGADETLSFAHRHFFYMPLMHAEDPVLQEKSVERFTALRQFADDLLAFAQTHSDEISRFGRFPYRNDALSREPTGEEWEFLKDRSRRG